MKSTNTNRVCYLLFDGMKCHGATASVASNSRTFACVLMYVLCLPGLSSAPQSKIDQRICPFGTIRTSVWHTHCALLLSKSRMDSLADDWSLGACGADCALQATWFLLTNTRLMILCQILRDVSYALHKVANNEQNVELKIRRRMKSSSKWRQFKYYVFGYDAVECDFLSLLNVFCKKRILRMPSKKTSSSFLTLSQYSHRFVQTKIVNIRQNVYQFLC